jgi:hypothetical protein
MTRNKRATGHAARLLLFIFVAAGLFPLVGCKTMNKVNPISDDSYFQYLFALPHKAVKMVLDIDEE